VMKATNLKMTPAYLSARTDGLAERGFKKSKWIEFCENMLARDLTVHLYEARQTRSKYVTVSKKGHSPFKVRFSNHAPIKSKEASGDCDFFVGVTNFTVTTTGDALAATLAHFGMKEVTP
jgi:hypothetical protein